MGIPSELTALSAQRASGVLEARNGQVSGRFWMRDGRVAAVALDGDQRALGMRLVGGGALSLTALGQALQAQQQHPQMRLGDILVRMGLVAREQIEAVAWEQMCDETLTMLNWPAPMTNFATMPPEHLPPAGPSVDDLLSAARARVQQLQDTVRHVGGAESVPQLLDAASEPDTALRPAEWSVLCRIDGQRSIRAIAEQSGFTLLEAGAIVKSLVSAGLVSVPVVAMPPVEPKPAPWPTADHDPTEFLRELSELGGSDPITHRRHSDRSR